MMLSVAQVVQIIVNRSPLVGLYFPPYAILLMLLLRLEGRDTMVYN